MRYSVIGLAKSRWNSAKSSLSASGTSVAGPAAHMAEANANLLTIVQIETLEAAAMVDEIASLPGVDLLYMGPGDLSIALGHPGQITHPEVMEVVSRMSAACRAHGKIAGCHFADPAVLPRLRSAGIRFAGFGAAIRMFQAGVRAMGEAALSALRREEM